MFSRADMFQSDLLHVGNLCAKMTYYLIYYIFIQSFTFYEIDTQE